MISDDLLEVHRLGHMLSDVKTALHRDISISVGGLVIRGRQDEVVSMPLWVGRMLQEKGIATPQIPDSITELKQAIIKEQVVGEHQLAMLDTRFYIRLWLQITSMEGRDRDGVEGIMTDLLRLRRGKIVQLADSSELTGEIKSRITVEEQIFFDTIHKEGSQFVVRAQGNE